MVYQSMKKQNNKFFKPRDSKYAPASAGRQQDRPELQKIGAVAEREHFHMDFLKGYPDADLNCVKDLLFLNFPIVFSK